MRKGLGLNRTNYPGVAIDSTINGSSQIRTYQSLRSPTNPWIVIRWRWKGYDKSILTPTEWYCIAGPDAGICSRRNPAPLLCTLLNLRWPIFDSAIRSWTGYKEKRCATLDPAPAGFFLGYGDMLPLRVIKCQFFLLPKDSIEQFLFLSRWITCK